MLIYLFKRNLIAEQMPLIFKKQPIENSPLKNSPMENRHWLSLPFYPDSETSLLDIHQTRA